jgi:hypothetical protein
MLFGNTTARMKSRKGKHGSTVESPQTTAMAFEVRSESIQPSYPCVWGAGGVATVYRCLMFGEEGDGSEMEDGFGSAWYPRYVIGIYGSENERIHMNTQVRLEVGG